MPHKPKRLCVIPGCLNETNHLYCKEHSSQANRRYNQYRRGPESNKRYDSRWRSIRDLYISKHPLCQRCLEAGHYVPAEEVHHILPLADGGDNSDANLMSLCKSCHSSITLSAMRNNNQDSH